MTTPTPLTSEVPFVEPDEVLADTVPEPTDVTVDQAAMDAARAVVEQEAKDAHKDVVSRSVATLAQSAGAAGLTGAFAVYQSGVHDWKVLVLVGAQAALTPVITYFYRKVKPAK